MKTTTSPKGAGKGFLFLLLLLAGFTAQAQLASFTRTYSFSNLSRVAYNQSNMIVTPYYGSDEYKPGYLMATNVENGGILSVKLTAIHPSGTQMWTKTYRGYNGNEYGDTRCFALTRDRRDNGYVLTGYRSNVTTGKDELWVFKVDAAGNFMHDYSFTTDVVPCTKGGPFIELPCQEFANPNFYGMDILQVAHDKDSFQNGDFVITGFVSDKPAVDNYKRLKRNFIWRFYLAQIGPATLSPIVHTRYLKVFHSWGINNDNEPTSEDFSNEIQEMPGHGIMILGHVTGSGPSTSPVLIARRPYYALVNYDGGGMSTLHSSVFQYANYTETGAMKNVRTLFGKDEIIYMLGYYYPTHSFSLTAIKPTSGAAGLTHLYYAPNVADLPAFSMYQNRTNSSELVIMGYRLGLNEPVSADYVHPYTIKIGKNGRILSKFNLEAIRSPAYNTYTPADPVPGGVDYFRPFEKVFPLATLPEIGTVNQHLQANDGAVAGVLYRNFTGGLVERFHATLSQFRNITEDAECHPYQLSPDKDSLQFVYKEFRFNINNIELEMTGYETRVTDGGAEYGCSQIPEQRQAGPGNIAASAQTGFTLYPNPAGEQITIAYEGAAQDMDIAVYDLTGRMLQSHDKVAMDHQPYALNLGQLIPGVYVIVVTDQAGHAEKFRIIKE